MKKVVILDKMGFLKKGGDGYSHEPLAPVA